MKILTEKDVEEILTIIDLLKKNAVKGSFSSALLDTLRDFLRTERKKPIKKDKRKSEWTEKRKKDLSRKMKKIWKARKTKRHKRKKKIWTTREDRFIRKELKAGTTQKKIAERLGVNLPILKHRIRKLRGKE